ncbi:AraC family transcriptional regulator [Salinisphaera sp. Q1T1-3]|uniref:AraC family transcriptional regulator n=1 Tax=Salinisphaera sp. Q1T1-3 TaxID=2321229 RepID=UPI000E749ED6|nr:AraC family transcriptional regulator [Salinisphaera sp. Q1T1-3]RJS94126.1 AraC family transcriptional regulator [Salinisphaera sp. Q1T1-3]
MPNHLSSAQAERCARLARRIEAHLDHDGYNVTDIPELQLLSAREHRPRQPVCYAPGLMFFVQGDKTGYVDDRVIRYGPGHYLVQAMPLPFECETFIGPGDAPLLGVALRLDADLLAELISEWPAGGQWPDDTDDHALPMAAVTLDDAIGSALERLLDCLDDTAAARALGSGRVREVVFEALRGPQGHLLRRLMSEQGIYARVGQAIARLQADFTAPVSVAELARAVNMSVSSFHAHFKRVTRVSPLQYQKRLRLLRSRELLLARYGTVAGVAAAVGYQSASQFSREYKRYFGVAPVSHAEIVQAAV